MAYRRKGSPHFYYDFTINGRRFRGSTQAPTREEAEIVEAELRRQALIDAATGRKPQMTLDTATGKYWLEHASHLPSSETIHYQLRNILSRLGKDRKLSDIRNPEVADLVAWLRGKKSRYSTKAESRLLSPASVNRHLTLLRAVMTRARDVWEVEVGAVRWKLHRLPEAPARDKWLTPEQANVLLDEAAPHLRPAIAFSLLTGLRMRNVMALDWRQVDIPSRIVRVVQKGNRRLTVELSKAALVVLANLTPKDSGPVFTRTERTGIERPIKSWRTAWEGARRRAGLDDFRFHDLRHTFAAWARQSGADLDIIRRALGHSDIATTLRYAHIGEGTLRRTMEDVAAKSRLNYSEAPRKVLKDNTRGE